MLKVLKKKGVLQMDSNNLVIFFLMVGLTAFGAEQLLRMIGKGEYIPYIRIGGLATCIIRTLAEVAIVLAKVKTFAG